MNEMQTVRRRVWQELQRHARPDSRYHWDFTAFIPDFEGSQRCTETVAAMELYQRAQRVFVTPDNNLASLRARCLLDAKTLIVPTYAIRRGFWLLERQDVPQGQEAFAATLDGLEVFATPLDLDRLASGDHLDLLVTGASVINSEGVRISPTPSYFDLEWLILRTLGLVEQDTPVVACVHDCQLVDWPCEPHPLGSVVDLIVTPTGAYEATGEHPKPAAIRWEHLPWQVVAEIPMLRRLYERG